MGAFAKAARASCRLDEGSFLGALAVIWAPVGTFARVAAEDRRVLLAFAVTALHAALNLVAGLVAFLGGATAIDFDPQDFPEVPPETLEAFESLVPVFAAGNLVYAVLSPFIGWLVVSLLMHLVTRFFGGTGPISGTFAAVGIAGVPLVIAAALGIPLTGLQAVLDPESPVVAIVGLLVFLLFLAAYLWNIVLVVIGSAFARRVGYGESAGSCAISCAGIVGLILIVVVGLVLLAVLLGSAAGSAGPS